MNSVAQQFLTPDAISTYAREIDPSGNSDFAHQLRDLSTDELFEAPITNHDMADCCKSGLLLLHNFLHESHDISQSIHTAEGSWLHAIMHRTEGDFSNAKYWYRRVGDHEAFGDIASGFAPFSFVDQCEKEYQGGALSEVAQQLAFAEWQALFDYCYQNSV
jgi:hypothetical protein